MPSDTDWKKEQKAREKKQTTLLNSHLREIQRKKADAYNIGSYTDDDSIMSKTDQGRMTTSMHPKTGEIHHVWHDVPQVVTDKSTSASRGNSQMRDTKKGESWTSPEGHTVNVAKQKKAAEKTARRLRD